MDSMNGIFIYLSTNSPDAQRVILYFLFVNIVFEERKYLSWTNTLIHRDGYLGPNPSTLN